jgi:hypothetical protein
VTRDEARIVLLEQALEQAQNTVSFLHGCLTDPGYKYAYPEQTQRNLDEWAALVPRRPYCVHSFTVEGCESCAARVEGFERRAEAITVLEED